MLKHLNKKYIKNKILKTGYFDKGSDLNKYVEIIFNNQNRKINDGGYTETHHWMPKCYFKHTKKTIDNRPSNLVNLLYKDHIWAHYFLCKSCNDDVLFLKLAHPLETMRKETKWKHVGDLKSFLNEILEKLQKILNKKQKLNEEKAREFYNFCNKFLLEGKTYTYIDKKLNKPHGYVNWKYFEYCEKYNWKRLNKMRSTEAEDKQFYDFINDELKKYKYFAKVAKVNKLDNKKMMAKYFHICQRRHWKNLGPDTYREDDLKFYAFCNSEFKKGKNCNDIDRQINKKNYAIYKYITICKRYNLKNLNPFSTPSYSKEEYINFYNKCNEYFKKGKDWNYLVRIFKEQRGTLTYRYKIACKKYKLKNQYWNKGKYIRTTEKDKVFYDFVNSEFKKNRTFSDIDKSLGKKKWALLKYSRICKRNNWPNLNPNKRCK